MGLIKKYLLFNLAYALLFILVLASGYKQFTLLNYGLIPCITLVLMVFFCLTTKLSGRFHQRLFTGLVFALTGSALFLLRGYNPSWFSYGLVAFLICHLFYIGAFYLDFRSAQELDKKGARIAIFSSAITFTAFYFYLRPHLGTLRLPVLACIFIVALLIMMAAFRNQRVNQLSFKLILTGVLFFIFADALLAHTYFISPFEFSDLLISVIYMIAQYLIVIGGAERKLIRPLTAD
ncbi:putative membrane protein YhhN [Pedobacter cryoconitis]|uniref:Putative membrane protein YhhN n=1 Tax=Pedobacter cryoconitis TaxID=188932 RepID=A0A7W9DKB3_9SPHI|nr:lysoplasmalogenase [Pedobacter cryoconitis]MBB5621040.1 putative membrane protein YhhN [Pedobacter cryoconitis]